MHQKMESQPARPPEGGSERRRGEREERRIESGGTEGEKREREERRRGGAREESVGRRRERVKSRGVYPDIPRYTSYSPIYLHILQYHVFQIHQNI